MLNHNSDQVYVYRNYLIKKAAGTYDMDPFRNAYIVTLWLGIYRGREVWEKTV